MKRDLLIQIDGKMPNPALRKLGGFLKEKGHRVFYDKECSDPDHVYISCIFQKNAPRARGIAKRFTCPVEVGGYGVNGVQLPDEVEHHMPDYEGMDYSFGCTTRGCVRNCPWCLSPDTSILLSDLTTKKIGGIKEGDKVIGLTKTNSNGRMLYKFKESLVLGVVTRKASAYRITLKNGQSVICSGNHRWLTLRGWKNTIGSMNGRNRRPYLTTNNRIRTVGRLSRFRETKSYMKGYISGIFLGDGCIRIAKDRRPEYKSHPHIRLAMSDRDALYRSKQYLQKLGLQKIRERIFRESSNEHPKRLFSIYSQRWDNYHTLNKIINLQNDTEFQRGFVAGFFDAEGGCSGNTLRITNKNQDLINYCCSCLGRFGFSYKIENHKNSCTKICITRNQIQFFNIFNPAISRKRNILGKAQTGSVRVKSIEKVGEMLLYDIQTATGNFIANGLVSHNCVVPKMEGYIRDHAPISEFHNPDHDKLILFDNNLLALKPKFKEDMDYVEENNLKVSFGLGLDIRFVDEEIAVLLAGCRYYSLQLKERRLYFAFDTMGVEHAVRRGVKILKEAGIKPRHLMFFMLCGFQEPYDFAQDWYRFKALLELGVDPYVMKYNGRRDIRILNHFSRWVIKRDYKRKQPKYLRPHEWEKLQEAILQAEMEIKRNGKKPI